MSKPSRNDFSESLNALLTRASVKTTGEGASKVAVSSSDRAVEAGDDASVRRVVAGKGHPGADDLAWDKSWNRYTSLIMDAAQHKRIVRLARQRGVSLKEFMYFLLGEGLERYEKGELKFVDTRWGNEIRL